MDSEMATPVWIKVYKYVMNGHCTGHLYLNRNSKVQWHNRETNMITRWHGEWYTTHDRRAIKIHFDFEGIEEHRKWAWLKEFDGIDYLGRWIAVQFVCNYTSHDGGQTYRQMPLPNDNIEIQRNEWEIL